MSRALGDWARPQWSKGGVADWFGLSAGGTVAEELLYVLTHLHPVELLSNKLGNLRMARVSCGQEAMLLSEYFLLERVVIGDIEGISET